LPQPHTPGRNSSSSFSRMTAAAGKDWFWLDETANGRELAEASRAVQPNLISSSLTENHKHKCFRALVNL
jgi:hypothetical protein